MSYTELLNSFTIDSLPNLDTVTLGALELFAHTELPSIDFKRFKRPLVVGSGNAAIIGKLLFDDVDALFADEATYLQKLDTFSSIDGAYLLSASGSKHAVGIAQTLQQRGIPCLLLTNNTDAPAREFVAETYVFPKNREPYTYNTSTYMGMLLSKTDEDASEILRFITEDIAPLIPNNFTSHEAFYLLLPERFAQLRELFVTKFDELFGPRVMGRIFTYEQTKHAKTVIPLESELFISFGVDNKLFGTTLQRLSLPMREEASYAEMMAVGYYVIGLIQKQLPPYYKERIVAYTKETSEAFGSDINPIVE